MAERNPSDDGFALIDQGLAEFLDWFGQTKRVWQLEEMVRDLIPPDVGASEAGDDFVDAIITRLATTPVGVSALHVMGKVAVPLVALRARSTVERIIEQGGPKPSSLARRCGGLVPVQAWRMAAQQGDAAFLLVCARAGSTRVQVAFVATMDLGDGPILTEGSLTDPLPEADARSLVEVFEVQGLRSQEVAVTQVAADIVNLAKHNIATDRGPTAELLLVRRPVAKASRRRASSRLDEARRARPPCRSEPGRSVRLRASPSLLQSASETRPGRFGSSLKPSR